MAGTLVLSGGIKTWVRWWAQGGHVPGRCLQEKPRTPELGVRPHPKEAQPRALMAVGDV